jgi:glycosyltransferase involved in cell wall biosynthesis
VVHLETMIHNLPQPALAYILKGYPRISETFISNEILLLESLGFNMRLFSMRKPRESFCHASVKLIKARVDYLPTELQTAFFELLVPNLFLAAKKTGSFKAALAAARDGLTRGNELATLKHLLQAGYMTNKFLVREPEIRQLHGHFAHSPTSVTLFASVLSGIPFSFTAHAKDIYTSRPEKLFRKINQASFVVTCTKHNRDYLRKIAGGARTPIYCIYHGIDLKLFNHSRTHTGTEPPFNILTIARMTEKKGLPTIYQALDLLRRRGVRFHHTLVGDGDDRELLVNLIRELRLEDQCRLAGTLTHEEVLKFFRESDLFVLGCQIADNGDRDGIPNVLVESLAMGVPAVSTEVSAIPEIIVDGATGLTVPPSNPGAMADAMLRLLCDRELREKVRDRGYSFVADHFDNSLLVKEFAGIFKKHNSHFSQ